MPMETGVVEGCAGGAIAVVFTAGSTMGGNGGHVVPEAMRRTRTMVGATGAEGGARHLPGLLPRPWAGQVGRGGGGTSEGGRARSDRSAARSCGQPGGTAAAESVVTWGQEPRPRQLGGLRPPRRLAREG